MAILRTVTWQKKGAKKSGHETWISRCKDKDEVWDKAPTTFVIIKILFETYFLNKPHS